MENDEPSYGGVIAEEDNCLLKVEQNSGKVLTI